VIERGELWWVDFGEPRGSGPAWRRPAVVVQDDSYNRSRLGTVIVAGLTTNLRLALSPGNVFVPAPTGGLKEDSVVDVTQLGAVDRRALDQRIGVLPGVLMVEVERGLRLVLALR
jgi:mRNA interferase MazF